MIIPDKTANKPKNKAELELWNKLECDGWFISKKGWPDFACFKNGDFMAIEGKPKSTHNLKRAQQRTMNALKWSGVKCLRWSPDGGFEKV